jgi:hypothetical protein
MKYCSLPELFRQSFHRTCFLRLFNFSIDIIIELDADSLLFNMQFISLAEEREDEDDFSTQLSNVQHFSLELA